MIPPEVTAWAESISLLQVLVVFAIITWLLGKLVKSIPRVKNGISIYENLGLLPDIVARLIKMETSSADVPALKETVKRLDKEMAWVKSVIKEITGKEYDEKEEDNARSIR